MPDLGRLERPWRPERIVVGVDIVGVNWPAVRWAVREARRRKVPMVLVGSTVAYPPPPELPRGQTLPAERLASPTWEVLDDVRARLTAEVDDVRVLVVDGEPPRAIAGCAGEHDLVVVGRRNGHPVVHALWGSTSMATAGRSAGPVVVVPDDLPGGEPDGPVVAGVREPTDVPVVELAFSRAADLRAPLLVVSAWDVTTPYGITARELHERREAVEATLEQMLKPARDRYPTVPIRTRCEPLTPTAALIAAAGHDARILVVGRHTGTPHLGGLSATSTVRHVLRHAPCPVMVVPTSTRRPSASEEMEFDDADVPEY